MIELISIKSQSNWQVKIQIQNLRIKPQFRDLLNILLSFRNPKSVYSVFPSVKTIAEKYGKSREQTRRDLRGLEDLGYIRALDCYRKTDHAQGANVYVLLKTILNPLNIELRKVIEEEFKPRASLKRCHGQSAAEQDGACAEPLYYEYDAAGRRKTKLLQQPAFQGAECHTPPVMDDIHNSVHSNPGKKYNTNPTTTNSLMAGLQGEVGLEVLECLNLYQELFGTAPNPRQTASFTKAYRTQNLGKETILAGFRTLAANPMLKETTFSPNRVFNLESVIKSQKFVYGTVKRITKQYAHNHDLWLTHIMNNKTLGRWHSGNAEAIARTAYWVAYGKSADELRHLWDETHPDFDNRTPAEREMAAYQERERRRLEYEAEIEALAVQTITTPEEEIPFPPLESCREIEESSTCQEPYVEEIENPRHVLDETPAPTEVDELCDSIIKADCIQDLKASKPQRFEYIMKIMTNLKMSPEGIDIEFLREMARDPYYHFIK